MAEQCLTQDEIDEYYKWIDLDKPSRTKKRGDVVILSMDEDGEKLKMFEDYEKFIGEDSKIYKSMAYNDKQTRLYVDKYVKKRLVQQQVQVKLIADNVDNNHNAIIGLRKKVITSELVAEKLIETSARQQVSLNNLREYERSTRKIMMDEIMEQKFASKELIVQKLDHQRFAVKHKTAWTTKDVTPKILQSNRPAMNELKEYLINELNKLAKDVFKEHHHFDFKLAVRYIRLIP